MTIVRGWWRLVPLLMLAVWAAAPAMADERWYGIYQENNKLGYSRETVTDDTVAGLTTTGSHTELNLVMGGNRIRLVSEGQLTFDREFTPREFNYRVKGGMLSIRVAGRTEGDTVYVTVLLGKGQRQELQFPRRGMTLASLAEWQLRGRDLQPGDSFTFTVFDPTIVQNGELTIRVEGREKLLWGDRLVPVTKMTATFAGIAGVSYIDEQGVPLLMTAPMGLTLRLEEKELALAAAAGEPVDLMLSASIPVTPPIANPRQLRRQSYRLTGADLAGTALDGGMQRLADSVLTVTVPEDFPAVAVPELSPAPEYLAFDLALDGDNPEVAALAEQLMQGSYTTGKHVLFDVIRADLDWLHRNIKRELTFSLPRASQVLQMKRGDCNEHATLMTALLRAQHIPARVAAGVVYVEGSFYYHAWTEVWTGETWLPVDPVFGQEIADATHIRLATGDLMAQAGLLNLIGKLRIEPLGDGR